MPYFADISVVQCLILQILASYNALFYIV